MVERHQSRRSAHPCRARSRRGCVRARPPCVWLKLPFWSSLMFELLSRSTGHPPRHSPPSASPGQHRRHAAADLLLASNGGIADRARRDLDWPLPQDAGRDCGASREVRGNAGCYRPFRVSAPEGSVLNAVKPLRSICAHAPDGILRPISLWHWPRRCRLRYRPLPDCRWRSPVMARQGRPVV
jgi:hypothetical protein